MIGYKFRLKKPMLGMPVGSVGYVFNEYPDYDDPKELGIQLIFENGNYDGFSIYEQNMFLEPNGFEPTCCTYVFENVMKVQSDFEKGYWKWKK